MTFTKANVGYPEIVAWLNHSHLRELDRHYFAVTPQMFGAFGDGTSHPVSAGEIAAHPEWLGSYDEGTEWDVIGWQEMLYHCYGGPGAEGIPTDFDVTIM